MSDCKNLNIQDLLDDSKKLKEMEESLEETYSQIIRGIEWTFESYEELSIFKKELLEGRKLTYDSYSNNAAIIIRDRLKDLDIKEGYRALERQRRDFREEIKSHREEVAAREEELLKAWSNFNAWKATASAGLIKSLNTEFNQGS